jgi:hypothetical protein
VRGKSGTMAMLGLRRGGFRSVWSQRFPRRIGLFSRTKSRKLTPGVTDPRSDATTLVRRSAYLQVAIRTELPNNGSYVIREGIRDDKLRFVCRLDITRVIRHWIQYWL